MTYRPSIRTQQDLEDAWRHLLHPLGFSGPSVWFLLIDADGELRDEFAPGGRVAFARSRPGAPALGPEDRAWARTLYGIGRVTDLPVEVVHLACDRDVVPVPMDEVMPDSAA